MRIAILGYGVEGKSAEKFLKKKFSVARLPAGKARIEVRDIKLQGKNYLKNLAEFDMIVRSPGIPYLALEIQRAKKKGVVITSATKLFFRHANGMLVGITGTKGKGTVATLLYKILKAAGKDAHLIGNMGIPMLDELPKLKKNSISVLELSSFQLQDLDVSPHIAVILDISPDHLNYHKDLKEYLEAKVQLVNHSLPRHENNLAKAQVLQDLAQSRHGGTSRATTQQRGMRVLAKLDAETTAFYFHDNKFSKQIAQKSKGKKIPVFADHKLVLKILGAHNLKNASMAAAVGRVLGMKDAVIKKVIKNFKGLPHRLEFVREVNGVKYYNDSASTNPTATIAALRAFDAPKILIAGGASKNLSYKPIKDGIAKSNTKLVILYGENKDEICNAVGRASPVIKTRNLVSAVKIAFRKAKKGDVVILSPASVAFDQFSGYAERGEFFKKLVDRI